MSAVPPDGGYPGTPTPRRFGRYVVHRVIGRGGFATVYEGYDGELDRPVAIKVAHVGRTDSAEGRAAFVKEARQLARLQHPRIVTVFDAGVEGEHRYIVSALLSGRSLLSYLKQRRPDFRETAQITADITDALAHAHEQGVIHRDVKPSNIILTDDLGPVLIDFGLAFNQDDAGMLPPGRAAGTPSYMPPEQITGKGHAIGARSDIYSLGVVLYRMLCGTLPFIATDKEKLYRQILEVQPELPSQIDAEVPMMLELICLRAMAKDRAERYETAREFADDLREFLHTGAGAASERSSMEHAAFIDESSVVEPGPSVASVTLDPLDVRVCLQDGQEALGRAHYLRARARFETALDAVSASDTLASQEAAIHVGLVHALLLVEGPAHPAIEHSLSRALVLAGWEPGDQIRLETLGLAAAAALARGACDSALDIARELLAAARENETTPLFVEAHRVAGQALSMLGDRAAGGTHLDKVIERYAPVESGTGAVSGVCDAGVVSLACLASNLWALGQLRQSEQRLSEALALADAIEHPPSDAFVHATAARIHAERRDWSGARISVGRLVRAATGHALAEWLPWSAVLDGLVTAVNGDLDEGIVRTQDGLNGLRNVGADAGRIYALLTLGRLCLASSQMQRGLEAVDEALALSNEQGYAQEHVSELFRIRAALLLAQSEDMEPEAEDLLIRACEVARNQTARMYELRVVLDLVPLWVRAGKTAEARGVLDASLQWFDEGDDAQEIVLAQDLRARIGRRRGV